MSQEILEKANSPGAGWASKTAHERGRSLANLRQRIVVRQREIVRTIATETGRPVTEVANQEMTAALEMLRFFERKYPGWLAGSKFRYLRPGFWRKRNSVVFEPLGTVAVIGPSNFPFSLPVLASSAALLCGNTVILKPSERCPKTAALIRALVRESGFGPETFKIVEGGPAVAREVAADPAVRKVIAFGSYESGREIAEVCGLHFKPCLLELGGKSAAIVCGDADLVSAARGIAWSAFSAAGRSCVGIKTVYVPSESGRELVGLLVEEMKSIRPGDVLDPRSDMSDRPDARRLRLIGEIVRDARSKGAGVWTREGELTNPSESELAGPLIVMPVSPAMRILSPGEKVEGPVLAVRPVESTEQAVEETNGCLYGLGASIWARDLRKARAIAARLQAGIVWVNDCGVGLPQIPWGGTKRSGWGRLFSKDALTELVSMKAVSVGRPCGSKKKFWWFPYSGRKYETIVCLNEFLYGRRSLKNLGSLIRSIVKLARRAHC